MAKLKSTIDHIWMRKGDAGDYESFDAPYDAGEDIGYLLSLPGRESGPKQRKPVVKRSQTYGVSVAPYFVGDNYVSLFWGDADAQPTRRITDADLAQFRAGVASAFRDAVRIPAVARKSVKTKRKPTRKSEPASSLRMLR